MPFDSLPQETLDLAGLSWRLRNRETWPPGFQWDYSRCRRCAMGLAYQLKHGKPMPGNMPSSDVTRVTREIVADAKAMSVPAFHAIFWNLRTLETWHVTPEHVADAIDKHLGLSV